MIQKLIILGFLKRHSASGYDLKKFIKEDLGIFSQLNNHSIYYPLGKMEKEGLIIKREEKGGSHVKKYMYSITPKGEREFLRLAREALVSQRRPFIELDIALYFLPFLATNDIIPFLRLRSRFIDNVKRWLTAKEKELKGYPPNLTLLLKHHHKLADAEKEFIADIIGTIKRSGGKKRRANVS
ncbi:MAG: hypothetical protein B1H08_06035 [Candidatus Omnitrophica bacterium 4484_171]|nr:MAG: hypothetical protein B1H08_06035 [Candidatus Omnitrophica bacterium 4484_171]